MKKYIDGVGEVLYSSESDLTNINELLVETWLIAYFIDHLRTVEDAPKFLKNSSKSVLYYKELMNLDNFELCCLSVKMEK